MNPLRWVVAGPKPGEKTKKSGAAVKKHVVLSTYDSPGNPHYGGGGADVVHMIALSLSARYDVTVLTAAPHLGTRLRDGVRYRHLPVSWAGPRAGQLLFHVALPFAAVHVAHDLWIESFTPPFSTSFTPLFSRSPVIGIAQNLSGTEMWGRYRIPFFLIERIGLRFYHHVVVLNPADRDIVKNYAPSADIQIIPNSAPLPPVEDVPIGDGDHILFLGRIDIWHKGLDLLSAAYARSEVSMPLLIAGSGTPGDERKLAGLLAAAGSGARWIGRVSGQEKKDLLRRSAFLVMPSRHEPFGISALEGMSYGKPIVHFDLPSLGWMGGDINVPAFDIEALANEIRRLVGDRDARRELGLTARAAARHFDPDQTAARYMSVIDDVLVGEAADRGKWHGKAGARVK